MYYRIGTEHNDIVEVYRYLFLVLDHLIDHLDKHPGEAMLPWCITSHS